MSEQSSDLQQTELLKRYGLNDLYFFAKYILGYWWLSDPVHWDFCYEIIHDINFSLYLLPRGHCKTICFTIADTIRQHLLKPQDPIAIVCDALKRSAKKTRAIKWHFESNKVLKTLYADQLYQDPKKESPKWTDEEMVLPGHDGRQEASIMATSLENQPTGLHFPRVKCDDLVTPEGVTTRDQMDKTRQGFGLFRSSILQVGGNLQTTGTIYNDGDLHCEMEKSGVYKTYKKPAIDLKTKGALWSDQFPLSKLDEIRKDPLVGDYIFSCQYLLDPAPEDKHAFYQLAWFGRYSSAQIREWISQRIQIYATADLAISEKESACFTALIVWGVTLTGEIPILHVRRGHWDSLKIAEELIRVQRHHRPLIWGIETENIARTIGPFLQRMQMDEQVFLNIEDFIPHKDKVARSRSIQGRAKQGLVYLPEQGANQPDWLVDFEHEIRRFPRAATKDQADSFGLIGLLLDRISKPMSKDDELKAREGTNIFLSIQWRGSNG